MTLATEIILKRFSTKSPLIPDAARIYSDVWQRDVSYALGFFETHTLYPHHIGYIAWLEGRAVGMGFGTQAQKGQWWYNTVSQHVPANHPALQSAWVLTELAVLPAYQGRGIGELIHNQLLHMQPFEYTLLSTQKSNVDAQRFYIRHGWQVLHQGIVFISGQEPFTIFMRPKD